MQKKALNQNGYREKLSKTKVATTFGLLWAISQFLTISLLSNLNVVDVFKHQISLSSIDYYSFINLWESKGLLGYYKLHLYSDVFHIVCYSFFFSSLLAKNLNYNCLSSRFNVLVFLPFLSGMFDIIENIMQLIIFYDLVNNHSTTMITLSGISSNLKWFLINISMILVFVLRFRSSLKVNLKTI